MKIRKEDTIMAHTHHRGVIISRDITQCLHCFIEKGPDWWTGYETALDNLHAQGLRLPDGEEIKHGEEIER